MARLVVLVLLVAGACGGSSDGGSAGRIEIEGYEFPDDVTVEAGAEVTVVNADAEPHTVTADDGAFDTGSVGEERTFAAPSAAGSYAYHCEVHPTMTATLVVEEA